MKTLRRILLGVACATALPITANAGLILTLSDDGSDGTIATFVGSGTTTGSVGTTIDVGNNIGGYVAAGGPNFVHFSLATALSFTSGASITELFIDDDGTGTNDDFHFDVNSSIGANVAYNINASSLVTGLKFSDLVAGTYAGTGNESARLGGFTLKIADARPVSEPGMLTLLAGGFVLLGLSRRAIASR